MVLVLENFEILQTLVLGFQKKNQDKTTISFKFVKKIEKSNWEKWGSKNYQLETFVLPLKLWIIALFLKAKQQIYARREQMSK